MLKVATFRDVEKTGERQLSSWALFMHFFFVILEQSRPLGHRPLSLAKTLSFRLGFPTPALMPRDAH